MAMSGFSDRIEKIRQLIDERGLDSIVLRRNPNLAWAIAGRAHVPTTIDAACFDLVITTTSVTAVTNVIEAPRLVAEEFPEGIEVKTVDWWQGRDALLPTGTKVGSDQPGADRIDVSLEIEILRASLVAEDVDRFKTICSDAAIALGNALKQVETTDREIDVAGLITHALWQSDLEISFLGVAGSERVHKFRHPLPTDVVVGNRVSASICAKRKGLIASVTRIVTFGPVSESMLHDYESIVRVEAAMFDATIVGSPFSAPIDAAIAAYPAHGFASDEWTQHHQGGPTGYLPRDWPANSATTRLIAQNQPIAWNPTGKGFKAEDTILATIGGIQIVSVDPDWPQLEIAGRMRPALLQR